MTDDDESEDGAPSGERRSSHIGPGSTASTPPGGDDPEDSADSSGAGDLGESNGPGESNEPGRPNDSGRPNDPEEQNHPREPADAVDADPDAGAAGSGDGGDDAPLSDLRADVDERRGSEADDEDLFSEMATGDADEDDVWEALSESADDPLVESDLGPDAAAGGDVTVVDKSLCHGCPHFADPPDTACTHDGTTIEAEVDTDHFRVVDCPVVEERREMEASDFSADEG